jgi:hypothetical protein
MRRLALVREGEQLTGRGPTDFERLARGCELFSPDHTGLLAISVTLAWRCVRACVVPSQQTELVLALQQLTRFLSLSHDQKPAALASLEQLRARCFAAAPVIEQATVKAVQKGQQHLRNNRSEKVPVTSLDDHAQHTVDRYVRLAAHFSCAAVCHSLDAVNTPVSAVDVMGDSAGALSYQLTGLGAAKKPSLRLSALDQAKWEAARFSGSSPNEAALTLQIFHRGPV